jgi:transcriptional regulator with AAA-type ATPase domain
MKHGETTLRETSGGGAASSGSAHLLVTGDGTLRTFPLDKELVEIGRAPECDVAIENRALSRRHARLRLGAAMTVQDLGSTNGTRVARQTLRGGEPARLEPGESFHIGKLSFVVTRGARAGSDGVANLQVMDPTPAGAPPLVREVARSDVNVLILGETGTGKEVLAETLHELSERRGPLVRVHCAALSSTLLESELFGHEKGAFTGASQARAGLLESADGGTVFLDEVGELPEPVQVKLLRVIERREVLRVGAVRPSALDVRFVSATNRDLPAEVKAARFRGDLFFRLDGITLTVPPLRARPHQIARLALQFLREAGERARPRRAPAVTPDLLARLEAYAWPGNVRELKAALERALLLAGGGEVGPQHLALTLGDAPSGDAPAQHHGARATRDGGDDAEAAERRRILDALENCAGNQTRAAKLLGISRTTLVSKLAFHRISRPRK